MLTFSFIQYKPLIYVESEDHPDRMLFEGSIDIDDRYEKKHGLQTYKPAFEIHQATDAYQTRLFITQSLMALIYVSLSKRWKVVRSYGMGVNESVAPGSNCALGIL